MPALVYLDGGVTEKRRKASLHALQPCHRGQTSAWVRTRDLAAVLQVDAGQAGHVRDGREAHIRQARAALPRHEQIFVQLT